MNPPAECNNSKRCIFVPKGLVEPQIHRRNTFGNQPISRVNRVYARSQIQVLELFWFKDMNKLVALVDLPPKKIGSCATASSNTSNHLSRNPNHRS